MIDTVEKMNAIHTGDHTNTSRNLNIDFIRIIACFAVVGLHTTYPQNGSIAASVLYYLCGFAVPFFFMASSYFLLNRGLISWKYVFKKILSILRLVIIWEAIILPIALFKQLVESGKRI